MSLSIVVEIIAQIQSKAINYKKFLYFKLNFFIIIFKTYKLYKKNIII